MGKNIKNVVADMEANKIIMKFFLRKISQAVANLCDNHTYLLEPTDGIERQCHFRIAKKLAEILEPIQKGYFIDCEYNKNGNDIKLTYERNFRPDIIYHKRTRDTAGNIFVIEIKIKGPDTDLSKLYKYQNEPSLKYKYGFCISNIRPNKFIIHIVRKKHIARQPDRGHRVIILYTKKDGCWTASTPRHRTFKIT